jgi:hypothetical protein
MYFIGLDLGQRRDSSAIAVIRKERMAVWSPNPTCSFFVRHVERMELGMSYTKVVQRVCEIIQDPMMAGQTRQENTSPKWSGLQPARLFRAAACFDAEEAGLKPGAR